MFSASWQALSNSLKLEKVNLLDHVWHFKRSWRIRIALEVIAEYLDAMAHMLQLACQQLPDFHAEIEAQVNDVKAEAAAILGRMKVSQPELFAEAVNQVRPVARGG